MTHNASPVDRFVTGGDARRILVLGGTAFVGGAVVDQALRYGHQVTMFNRGITNPHLFPAADREPD